MKHHARVVSTTALLAIVGCSAAPSEDWTDAEQAVVQTGVTYTLVSVLSNKCLEIAGGSTANLAALQVATCASSARQQFRFEDMGGGFYRIRNVNSNLCLDVEGRSTSNGARVVQWTCGTGTNQQFSARDLGGTVHNLLARHSGQSLDVFNFGTVDGTPVVQWPLLNNSNQQFRLTPVTGGGGSGGAGGTAGSGGAPSAGGTPGSAADRCGIANLNPSAPPRALTLSGNLGTHDPALIGAHGRFYLFSTGNNVGAKTSTNLTSWQAAPEVFSSLARPAWLSQQVPGVSNLWAPDISFFGGQYHLYYSASSFGSNRSCIGHLTRPALDSGNWTERGPVICSNVTSSDNWNAIDPNVVTDQNGTPWLSFGSFWGGIKMIQLDQSGARVGNALTSLAARPNAGGAVEAPFIVRRCGFYYLFVSWDTCCQGANSTYNLRVGRSSSVTGPYVDRAGTALMQGGGTLVLQGDARWRGPGHNAVLFTSSAAYNVYHAYDAQNNGAPVLRVSELAWDGSGWPISGGP